MTVKFAGDGAQEIGPIASLFATSTSVPVEKVEPKSSTKVSRQSFVFEKPEWAGKPHKRGIHFEVWRPKKESHQLLKEGKKIDADAYYHSSNILIDTHSYYLFGSKSDVCDFTVKHPTCSRCHLAVVHHGQNTSLYVVDLNSTHGSFINGARISPGNPMEIKPGDTLRLALSSRKYILRLHSPIRKEVKQDVAAFLEEIQQDEENERKKQKLEEEAQPANRRGYHILIKHASVAKPVFRGKKITRTKEEAITFIDKLRETAVESYEKFQEIAKDHSECVSGEKSNGKMPPMPKDKDCGALNDLKDAIWSLAEGDVSQPIETQVGIHIVMWARE